MEDTKYIIDCNKIQGELRDFPSSIIVKMVENQIAQGNPANIEIFCNDVYAIKLDGGFNWDETKDGFEFWYNIISKKSFGDFFLRYTDSYTSDKIIILNKIPYGKVDTYGIENVNFTLIDKDDDRWNEYKLQRLERGFDDSEMWNLDTTIAKFIYPRLKRFSENIIGIPCGMTEDIWQTTLDSMVKAFELIVNGESDEKENQEIISKGLDNFRNYFFQLWN